MNHNLPQRGDIWRVNFDPTVGSEIRKTRPALVISSNGVGRLPIKLVAPITDWKDRYAENLWHVKIDPNKTMVLANLPQSTPYSCAVWTRSDSLKDSVVCQTKLSKKSSLPSLRLSNTNIEY